MNEQRFVVSDVMWQRLEPHLPGKVSFAGATAKDNRLFLEAVFWRVRTESAYSGVSGHSFRQHPATDSGVSGHL